jgi:hypothetical protein
MSRYSSMTFSICCFSCGGALSGGRGHNILIALREDHQENKFPSFGNELTAFFCNNQRYSGRRWYLWYHVQLISQGNNNTVRSGLIHSMSLPQVWLA